MTGPSSSSSTGALLRTGLAYPLNPEALNSGGFIVVPLFGPPAVDNISNTRNGQRRFRDVGGKNTKTSTFWRLVENLELFSGRKKGIERLNMQRMFHIHISHFLSEVLILIIRDRVLLVFSDWGNAVFAEFHILSLHDGCRASVSRQFSVARRHVIPSLASTLT
jgi:hypothetical protein